MLTMKRLGVLSRCLEENTMYRLDEVSGGYPAIASESK